MNSDPLKAIASIKPTFENAVRMREDIRKIKTINGLKHDDLRIVDSVLEEIALAENCIDNHLYNLIDLHKTQNTLLIKLSNSIDIFYNSNLFTINDLKDYINGANNNKIYYSKYFSTISSCFKSAMELLSAETDAVIHSFKISFCLLAIMPILFYDYILAEKKSNIVDDICEFIFKSAVDLVPVGGNLINLFNNIENFQKNRIKSKMINIIAIQEKISIFMELVSLSDIIKSWTNVYQQMTKPPEFDATTP